MRSQIWKSLQIYEIYFRMLIELLWFREMLIFKIVSSQNLAQEEVNMAEKMKAKTLAVNPGVVSTGLWSYTGGSEI